MNRRTTAGILGPVAALLLALAPLVAQAQTPPPRPPGGATQSGEVTSVNPLKVKVNGEEQLLRTAPDVVVNRTSKQVNVGELEKGDKVTFTTNPDNSVQRVDVTDAAADKSKVLVIALLVVAALALAALVWYLTQRRSRNRPTPLAS